MEAFDVVIALAVALLLAFQVWLTLKVWKLDSYEREQKSAQTKLIWFLPIAGALIVSVVMWQVWRETAGKPR